MASKKTPLYQCYERHGGRIVTFAGWSLPVQYHGGVIAEHRSVRGGAGLFDVSHMARFEVTGPGAESFLDRLLTNNVRKLTPGALLYTALCQEDGGTIDDLVVSRFDDRFLVVANAANHDAVWEWFRRHADGAVTLADRTATLAHLALQGPRSQQLLSRLVAEDLEGVPYYRFIETTWRGTRLIVSRNGYTGEDGFELYIEAGRAVALWEALFDAGGHNLAPVGLGARDTLRLEVAFPLYGQELSRSITPVEAGLGWVVKLKGRSFIGSERLRRQKTEGVERTLVGLEFEGRLIGRQGTPLLRDGVRVGEVSSGTYGPSVEKGIALGFVPPALAEVGTTLQADVRGREVAARVVPRPFYTKGSHR